MKQPVSKSILIGLGLAGLAGAILVMIKMGGSGSGRSADNVTSGPLRTHRSEVFQRPTAALASAADQTDVQFSSGANRTAAARQLENLDPGKAGWNTELLGEAAARAIAQIFGTEPDDKPVADDFRGTPLAPALATALFAATGVRIDALPIGDQLRDAAKA